MFRVSILVYVHWNERTKTYTAEKIYPAWLPVRSGDSLTINNIGFRVKDAAMYLTESSGDPIQYVTLETVHCELADDFKQIDDEIGEFFKD